MVVTAIYLYQFATTGPAIAWLLNFWRTLLTGDPETGFNHERPDSFFGQVDIVQFCKLFTRQSRPKVCIPALNVVINNAGIMPFDNAAGELDDAQAVTLLNTNLLGPVRVSAAFIEHLKQQPDAVLINNSSVLAFLPLATNALYSATKAAIHSYTLSQRFLLRDTGVQVIEISPPWVDTDLIYKSGDPRAMPLDAFISETFEKLGTDTIEAIVDRVLPVRDNPGANEHTLVNQFNQSVADNPIPVQ